MIDGLTFDAATHTYRFRGRPVPGVTSLLAPINSLAGVPKHILDAASAFGTAVHLACELFDKDELDEAELDPALKPYLDAWRQFSLDHRVSWTAIEEKVYHPTLRYAGTLDRAGQVQMAPWESHQTAVVDIKSSVEIYPAVGPQLAAYQNAITPAPQLRISVQLKPDGTYKATEHTGGSDWAAFCSLLTLRTWCAANAITLNPESLK